MKNILPIIKRMIVEANTDTIVFPSAQSVKMFFEEELVAQLFPPEFIHEINVVCMGDKTGRRHDSMGFTKM